MGTKEKKTDKIMTDFLLLVSISSPTLQIPLYFVCFWGLTPPNGSKRAVFRLKESQSRSSRC